MWKRIKHHHLINQLLVLTIPRDVWIWDPRFVTSLEKMLYSGIVLFCKCMGRPIYNYVGGRGTSKYVSCLFIGCLRCYYTCRSWRWCDRILNFVKHLQIEASRSGLEWTVSAWRLLFGSSTAGYHWSCFWWSTSLQWRQEDCCHRMGQ